MPVPSVLAEDLPPTLANYQKVANRSLDQFDELLNTEARQRPPAVPIQAASLLE